MSHDKFENHIRRTLSGHSSGMDTDAFWARLEAKRRRRRRFLLFWLPLALLAVGAGTYSWWWSAVSESTSMLPSEIVGAVSAESTSPAIIDDGKERTAELAQPQTTAPVPVTSSVSSAVSTVTDASPSVPESPAEAGDALLLNTPTESVDISQTQRGASDLSTDRRVTSPGEMLSKPETESLGTSPTVDLPDVSVVSVAGLQRLAFRVESAGNPRLPVVNVAAADRAKNPVSGRAAFTLFAEAQTGAGFAFRRFTAAPEFEPLRLARQEQEQPLEVLTGGLSIGLQHRSGWGLRTGLELRQFAERLDYGDTTFVSYPDSNVLLRIYEYPDGSREEEYGPGTVTEMGVRRVEHYNYYRFLAIPLAVRYEFGGDRWSAFLEAGASFALWKQATGRQIGGDALEPISIAEPAGEVSYFRTRLSPEVFLGGGLRWHATDQFSLSLQPEVRYRPGNLLPDENPLELRAGSVGIRLAARFNLNR